MSVLYAFAQCYCPPIAVLGLHQVAVAYSLYGIIFAQMPVCQYGIAMVGYVGASDTVAVEYGYSMMESGTSLCHQ